MLQVDEVSPADRIGDPGRQGTLLGDHMHGPAKANARTFNLKVHRASSLLAPRVCRHFCSPAGMPFHSTGAIEMSFAIKDRFWRLLPPANRVRLGAPGQSHGEGG